MCHSGLKVGQMTRTIWVTWVTFLVDQVGLIRKLNLLDVTRILIDHMFLRKRYWHLISERTLGLANTLNHHGVKPVYYLKVFWSMWCPEISFSRIPCMGPVLYPKKFHGIVSYLIYSMSFYITFKKKTLACGSQEGHVWITSRLLSGSSGSTSVTHFQPWCNLLLQTLSVAWTVCLCSHVQFIIIMIEPERSAHKWNVY